MFDRRERERGMKKQGVVVAVAISTAAAVLVIAATARQWKRRKERQWKNTQRILRTLARDSATPVPRLWQVADELVLHMQASLASHGTPTSLNMLVSYLDFLPIGYSSSSSSISAFFTFFNVKFYSLRWQR